METQSANLAKLKELTPALMNKLDELAQTFELKDYHKKADDMVTTQREWYKVFGDIKSDLRSLTVEDIDIASDLAAKINEKIAQVLTHKEALEKAPGNVLPVAAPAAGGKRKWKMPRKMSRKYCKKTPCRKMGFTQRSSCRPYKNCFTRKARRSA